MASVALAEAMFTCVITVIDADALSVIVAITTSAIGLFGTSCPVWACCASSLSGCPVIVSGHYDHRRVGLDAYNLANHVEQKLKEWGLPDPLGRDVRPGLVVRRSDRHVHHANRDNVGDYSVGSNAVSVDEEHFDRRLQALDVVRDQRRPLVRAPVDGGAARVVAVQTETDYVDHFHDHVRIADRYRPSLLILASNRVANCFTFDIRVLKPVSITRSRQS
jgi:hypothetical protein